MIHRKDIFSSVRMYCMNRQESDEDLSFTHVLSKKERERGLSTRFLKEKIGLRRRHESHLFPRDAKKRLKKGLSHEGLTSCLISIPKITS